MKGRLPILDLWKPLSSVVTPIMVEIEYFDKRIFFCHAHHTLSPVNLLKS